MRTTRAAGCAALLWVLIVNIASGAGSDVADAAQRGDRAAVQKLIQQKTDVNAPQVDGATAVHWAVYRADDQLLDLLIRAGADVKARQSRRHHTVGDGIALRQRGDHRSTHQGGC